MLTSICGHLLYTRYSNSGLTLTAAPSIWSAVTEPDKAPNKADNAVVIVENAMIHSNPKVNWEMASPANAPIAVLSAPMAWIANDIGRQ